MASSSSAAQQQLEACSSDFEDDSTELELQFAAAAKRLEQLVGQLDQKLLLRFYGLYKQATVGACNTAKPGLFALQAKAKWYAWNELGDQMTSEQAMQQYVAQMTEVQPDWQAESKSTNGGARAPSWAAVSRPIAEENGAEQTVADHVKESNAQRVAELLATEVADVNALDAEGLALLHWAADRGAVKVVEALLAAPAAQVDVRDASGQTALHYACSVGHAECVRALLEAGADRRLVDDEGQTCAEVAASEEIRGLVE